MENTLKNGDNTISMGSPVKFRLKKMAAYISLCLAMATVIVPIWLGLSEKTEIVFALSAVFLGLFTYFHISTRVK